ncbi:MAG TPA: hypothetical protein VET24_17255 [Actinomycetota bacterium]|nr:hypothetical protein [Actinomycetota bacterium]
MTGGPAAGLCASCGRPLTDHDHRRCELDPPRICPRCGRRMRVQVLPVGYRAACPVCDGAPAGGARTEGSNR